MRETILIMFVVIAFLSGLAFNVALWVFRRDDVSLADIYRSLPGQYGILWPFTKPEAYFRKKYVKYIRALYYIAAVALCSILLLLLTNSH